MNNFLSHSLESTSDPLITVEQGLPFPELLLEPKELNRDTFTFLSCPGGRG